MIGIISYGSGNIKAILNVYESLKISAKVVTSKNELEGCSGFILPGVGSFDYAMFKFNESGLIGPLSDLILEEKMPVLGICVGMQMLADKSEEGSLPGLGWISGSVKRIKGREGVRLPHMGWNEVKLARRNLLMDGISDLERFYFLHSYYFDPVDKSQGILEVCHGEKFFCGVNKNEVYGVQFHPEKSHDQGIQLLNNFSKLTDVKA
ncbi:imidazole glycerol phosphate synthase subunit HisH [Polynucleobacter sp. AP-Feld-500C-C5]|uniref:imidazole glycerol phosphate synthase subunit HisH n=1 Tax=Polynucleobacter sp. AP-Feld-500C-C5 TaxID=2576924 RepID=UPI001C0D7D8C|nr:imidazole glycerol phosphate synthase subunit HisH [Polynucleobacter sp. AP-Feld-500C-C5]MBU3632899.1 imidazole glycerol phosphate synthase subunit HisH [Polynucleobacter sp. AP-Feld-500C-C5]